MKLLLRGYLREKLGQQGKLGRPFPIILWRNSCFVWNCDKIGVLSAKLHKFQDEGQKKEHSFEHFTENGT